MKNKQKSLIHSVLFYSGTLLLNGCTKILNKMNTEDKRAHAASIRSIRHNNLANRHANTADNSAYLAKESPHPDIKNQYKQQCISSTVQAHKSSYNANVCLYVAKHAANRADNSRNSQASVNRTKMNAQEARSNASRAESSRRSIN